MKKYRTLFYEAKVGDGKYIDNLISLSTQLLHCWRLLDRGQRKVIMAGYSHEEIWTPDEDGKFSIVNCHHCSMTRVNCFLNGCPSSSSVYYLGTCWTSTMGQVRGGNNVGTGTCKRSASLVLKHPERWSYTEHLVSDYKYDLMAYYLDDQVAKNKGYGLGPNKNICSEISHNANVVSGELAGPPKVVTPIGDALSMVRSGKKIIPLK